MILADTSVWVDHLSRGTEGLASLLDEEQVVMHPFVIGELACGLGSRFRELWAKDKACAFAAQHFERRHEFDPEP